MLALDLINDSVPALKPADNVGQALDWMQDNRVTQLAVSNNEEYVGMLTEDYLLNFDENTLIEDIEPQYPNVMLYEHQHLYESLSVITDNNLSIVPVVDENKKYLGIVLANDIYKTFAEMLGFQQPGAIIEIAISNRDYSLAEISRLIESDRTKILSSFFQGTLSYSSEETSKLILKLNRQDIAGVIATLERFGYVVEAAYSDIPVTSLEQERYDGLMKYLSI